MEVGFQKNFTQRRRRWWARMNVLSVHILLSSLCRITVPRRFFTLLLVLVNAPINIITSIYNYISSFISKCTSLVKLSKRWFVSTFPVAVPRLAWSPNILFCFRIDKAIYFHVIEIFYISMYSQGVQVWIGTLKTQIVQLERLKNLVNVRVSG